MMYVTVQNNTITNKYNVNKRNSMIIYMQPCWYVLFLSSKERKRQDLYQPNRQKQYVFLKFLYHYLCKVLEPLLH